MKIAMEIPTIHLEALSEYTDFDFCLAHLILEQEKNSDYVRFYRTQREKGREVWMDNSFYELGFSLTTDELLKAARIVNPTHLVAFEAIKDPWTTFQHVMDMVTYVKRNELPYKVVGTWQGSQRALDQLDEVCDVVALPYKRPRQIVLNNDNKGKYHFFGFRTLDELHRHPPRSIDTSAPIKYALVGEDMKTRERRLRSDLLNYKIELTDKQLEDVVNNIQLMREAAKGAKSYDGAR